MTTSNLLMPGDSFPALTPNRAGGDTLELPLPGEYTVVLFYRGGWCPYCNAQLRAFQRAQDKLAELGAHVVALSIDDEAAAQATIVKHDLTFPVAHSADARAIGEATGALVNPDVGHIESTGFVVGPDGKILVSVYSTNANAVVRHRRVTGRQPSFLLDGAALITGEVDRSTTFETGFVGHEALRDGAWQPDPLILDDQALIISLGERGLVILSGCGHAGATVIEVPGSHSIYVSQPQATADLIK